MAFCALCAGLSIGASLMVYGPGGPYPAIRECADVFAASRAMTVEVRKGEPRKQAAQAARDGDVYYSGAEYMMRDFVQANPGVIKESSVVYPAARRIGIIARQGNPKGIRSPADLAAPGIRILDVRLENMAGLRGSANDNVVVSVTTGEEGFAAWNSRSDLDAWVTYKTWSNQLQSGVFIPLEGKEGARRIAAGVIRNAPHPREAAAFIRFLQSDEARSILLKHGYE